MLKRWFSFPLNKLLYCGSGTSMWQLLVTTVYVQSLSGKNEVPLPSENFWQYLCVWTTSFLPTIG